MAISRNDGSQNEHGHECDEGRADGHNRTHDQLPPKPLGVPRLRLLALGVQLQPLQLPLQVLQLGGRLLQRRGRLLGAHLQRLVLRLRRPRAIIFSRRVGRKLMRRQVPAQNCSRDPSRVPRTWSRSCDSPLGHVSHFSVLSCHNKSPKKAHFYRRPLNGCDQPLRNSVTRATPLKSRFSGRSGLIYPSGKGEKPHAPAR